MDVAVRRDLQDCSTTARGDIDRSIRGDRQAAQIWLVWWIDARDVDAICDSDIRGNNGNRASLIDPLDCFVFREIERAVSVCRQSVDCRETSQRCVNALLAGRTATDDPQPLI